MVDTNQDAVSSEEDVKKRKSTAKKVAVKAQDKPEKRIPVKKDGTPAKIQSKAAGVSIKQTADNARRFLKGAWSELKKVHWPGRQQIIAYTGVVVVAVTLVAILIFAVDSILSRVLQVIIPN
ncbi:MAG: preprotein translocase subunit SecE [Thermincola sp.]|jgi:preprotein translocase subunit SecE|nr:preprotein translocase subunit SecE [Thermincola sp.]MDT3704872.1 preprotein translocase subunit SecE [Thermincola sp.]